jgi:uncharacterized protein (DUF885 family)
VRSSCNKGRLAVSDDQEMRVDPMSESASSRLSSLADDYWQARMANEPLYATSLGDRRYDDKLADITPKGRERIRTMYQSFLDQVERVFEQSLTDEERVTRTALLVDLRNQLDHASCGFDDWSVDPLGGPQVEFFNVEFYQPIRTFAEGRAMTERWNIMGAYLMEHIANLRRGLSLGKVAVHICIQKAVEETEDALKKPNDQWTLLRPLATPHEDWPEAERAEFEKGIRKAVQESIRPAFQRYLTFLKSELLPHARSNDLPGISHLPNGADCYRRLSRVHTSLPQTPNELHELGLGEVLRINGEMETLGKKLFGTSDRNELLRRLRTDPSLYFASRDEVEEKARSALDRATAAISKWFGTLPKVSCEVARMGEHEEKNSTIAYYREPAADGSRPGRYYINTCAPETRPRYEAEVLAYHEAVPGHHLQLAIAEERRGLPDFRKFSGVTAFVEGWGLYAERLADEMGLYSSNLDRMGMLSYDAWRACRLVVDTGMHAKGWTRQEAIRFMLENTALAENNVVNEVDRYITWPGQALAYKVGQLEILRLRKESKNQLGSRFDIREFHDALLSNGAVPLEVLRHIMAKYVKKKLSI